jgi:hypothetical protein
MSYQDFRLSKELMYIRRERLQRRTETRSLLRQAGLLQPSWLHRHRRLMLCQLGRGLVTLGKLLEQRALPSLCPGKGRGTGNATSQAGISTWPRRN